MSDYTPTTVDVKAAWRAVQLGRPEAHAEFERWLASVKADAWDEGFATAETSHLLPDNSGVTFANPYRRDETT